MNAPVLLVTARLATPLVGRDPPHLDSLLERVLAKYVPGGRPGYEVDRNYPAPERGLVRIPLERERLGECLIARCSGPIRGWATGEWVEHVTRRFPAEHVRLLAPDRRLKLATTNGWAKSYRRPLHARAVEAVAWICRGTRKGLVDALDQVHALGVKCSVGFGRVAAWDVVPYPPGEDHTWFAPTERGPVLMRPLPVGPWLPEGLVGCRHDFGAPEPPYWHSDRYTEIVVPC